MPLSVDTNLRVIFVLALYSSGTRVSLHSFIYVIISGRLALPFPCGRIETTVADTTCQLNDL